MNTHALFGTDVPLESITSVRVNRIRTEGALQAMALGAERTQVWLTLADGRTLTCVARDDVARMVAVEDFLAALDETRVRVWLDAIARGETVRVGRVTMTRDGIQKGRGKVAWKDLWWSFRDGGLLVDGPNHRLVFDLWIAGTPWSGAIAKMIERMAPGRLYDAMDAAQLPKVGFFATSALTHIPGHPKMRTRGYLLLALIGIPLLGLAGYAIWFQLESARMHGYYKERVMADAAKVAPSLASPAFEAIATCAPGEYKRYTDYLVTVRGLGKDAKLTRHDRPITEVDTYPKELLVWDVVGGEARGLYLEDRYDDDKAPCRVSSTGQSLEPLFALLEETLPKVR